MDVTVDLVKLVSNLHPGPGLQYRLGKWGQNVAVDGHGDGSVRGVHRGEVGDEDVIRKLKSDLADHNISDEEIRKKMDEFNEKAKSDFK